AARGPERPPAPPPRVRQDDVPDFDDIETDFGEGAEPRPPTGPGSRPEQPGGPEGGEQDSRRRRRRRRRGRGGGGGGGPRPGGAGAPRGPQSGPPPSA